MSLNILMYNRSQSCSRAGLVYVVKWSQMDSNGLMDRGVMSSSVWSNGLLISISASGQADREEMD